MDNTHSGRFVLIAMALAVAATGLGIYVAGDNVIGVDVRIAQWLQQWQGDLPESLERIGDMLGYTPTAIAVVLIGAAIAGLMRNRSIAGFFVIVGMLRVVGMGLKPMFDSPRPEANHVPNPSHAEGFGYPSGHSITAAMIAAIIVVIVWNTPVPSRFRWLATGFAAALGLLVGWSRVWSGAHWPTDVIGGWSYGVAFVLLAWGITRQIAGLRND